MPTSSPFFSNALPLARYRFVFRVVRPVSLPDYAGSTLRGAFGHALMHLSGLRKHDVHNKTPLFQFSPYAEIFEPQTTQTAAGLTARLSTPPVPYVIEAPLSGVQTLGKGDVFSFDMVVLAPALQHLSLIILAWRRALLGGFGRGEGGTVELMRVEHMPAEGESAIIYTAELPLVQAHKQTVSMPDFKYMQNVHVQVLTPLRLQHEGKIQSPGALQGAVFLRHLVRRVSLCFPGVLSREQILALNLQAEAISDDRRLSYKQWSRFSNRQQQLMRMDGAVGHWYFYQVPAQLQALLWLGQFLHLGKGTAYGLGGYIISEEPWRA